MTDLNERLLINIHELSALTGIAVGSLYRWAADGRLPCVRLSQRCLRFSPLAIQEWLAERKVPPRTETEIRNVNTEKIRARK